MYKIFFTLLILSINTGVYADVISVNHSEFNQRLELINKILSESPYSEPKLDTPQDNIFELKTNNEIDKEGLKLVYKEDYKRNGISVLYPDSHVFFNAENNQLSEIKQFKNNILMVRDLSSDFVSFFDMDIKDTEDRASRSWNVNCLVDRITDEGICVLAKFDLRLIKSSKSGLVLSISSEPQKLDFRQNHYLRIDKNTPFQTHSVFRGKQVNNIILQMQSGKTAYTRFHNWSETYEETLSLYGFASAYQTMNLMYKNLKIR